MSINSRRDNAISLSRRHTPWQAGALLLAVFGTFCPVLTPELGAQDSLPAATVYRSSAPLRLDGSLDEAVWRSADSVTDFTQRNPEQGRPATDRTVVRLIGTPDGLWVGIWATASEPGFIRHSQLRRDADLGADDSFTLMLAPQRDKRSGFLFSVNPNGAIHDAEILNFESQSNDWDGVWDARARITTTGWQAELFIPWQTLRYPAGSTEWGVNFRRFMRHKNEEVLWRASRRPEGIKFLEREGTLRIAGELPPRAAFELRPFAVATASVADRAFTAAGVDSITSRAGTRGQVGFDLKLAPAPTLTLDLTVNTDFAQADADRQVVNLSRFPLFFPERRTFFTEGSGIFDFGRVQQTQLFYSRRIGLGRDGSPIPVLGGARLNGRLGANQLGFLVVRTGGIDPATDLVARVKHDVLGRGYIGAITTFQQTQLQPASRAAGVDFNFPFIVGGQNLVFLGNYALNQDSARAPVTSHARFMIDYPNDDADIAIRLDRIDAGYAPRLGFVGQDGIYRLNGNIELTPRPGRWGIRRFSFKPLSWNIVTNLDGTPNNSNFEVRPLGVEFDSGDEIEVNLQRYRDAPASAFELFAGTDVSAGSYQWDRLELQLKSSSRRMVRVNAQLSTGAFYDGTGTELELSLNHRLEPHLLTSIDYQVTDVHRGTASFTATTVRLRLDYAANPRLSTTLFGQFDNESKRLSVNARARWTVSPGSDAYVVWNSGWPTGLSSGIPWSRPSRGALIVKFVKYMRRAS